MDWISTIPDGIEHITDPQAYDHMVFLIALVASYDFNDWKKIIWLATAFTVGHTITLILSALEFIHPNYTWIEFLIPVSILITALINLRSVKRRADHTMGLKYFLTVIFGLIHGMGFSGYFRMLVGKSESIVSPLIGFNIGVEIGQLCFLLVYLIIMSLIVGFFKVKDKPRIIFTTGLCVGIALILIIDTWPL